MKRKCNPARKIPPDFAYRLWYQEYNCKDIDDQIALVLSENIRPCAGGNLKKTRIALMISTVEMAIRNGILKRNYLKLEASDAAGTIKLKTLSALAKSMDCELVYFLRPKHRQRYSRILWDQLEPEGVKNGMYQSATGERKHRALYGSVKRAFATPTFARAQKWSQRRMSMFYRSE